MKGMQLRWQSARLACERYWDRYPASPGVCSIVVSTSRCGRDIPGSNPGIRISFILFLKMNMSKMFHQVWKFQNIVQTSSFNKFFSLLGIHNHSLLACKIFFLIHDVIKKTNIFRIIHMFQIEDIFHLQNIYFTCFWSLIYRYYFRIYLGNQKNK